jgi:hypothetical protein
VGSVSWVEENRHAEIVCCDRSPAAAASTATGSGQGVPDAGEQKAIQVAKNPVRGLTGVGRRIAFEAVRVVEVEKGGPTSHRRRFGQ